MSINKYNPDIHHRKSIRLSGYDYSQEGLYFITLCTQNRETIFGSISNGILTLNPIGEIAAKEWLNTMNVRDNVALHEFIIMPNHMHGIIEITKNKANSEDKQGFKSPTQTVGAIIRGYKIATIKQVKEYIGSSKGEGKGESKGESKGEGKGEGKGESKGEGKGESKGESKGELQFAPTAPTAYKIWQRNYYEHIIRDEKAYQNISNYIISNPERWNEDKFYK